MLILRVLFIVFFFGFCVFIHEFGHLLVAMWMGLKAEKFSIGFGPKIFGFTWRGVEFVVSWIPCGGYVMLPQLDPGETPKTSSGEELPIASAKARGLTAFAGPFFNVLFGLLLATVMYFVGTWEPLHSTSVMVSDVQMVLPVQPDGLDEDTLILSVNGIALNDGKPGIWKDAAAWLSNGEWSPEELSSVQLTIWRNDAKENIEVVPKINPEWSGGLRDGDRVVRVNGSPIASGKTSFLEDYLLSARRNVELVVERGGILHDIVYSPVPNPERENLGYPFFEFHTPLRIFQVTENSPAALAGLLSGDELLSVNGMGISSGYGFVKYLQDNHDSDVRLRICRNGNEIHDIPLNVRTDEKLTPEILGLEFLVLIGGVFDGTPAERAGLRVRDQIISIGGQRICSTVDMQRVIGDNPSGNPLHFVCRRDGQIFEKDIIPEIGADGRSVIGVILSDEENYAIAHVSPLKQMTAVYNSTARCLGLLFAPLWRQTKSLFTGKEVEAPQAKIKLQHMAGAIGIMNMLWLRLKEQGIRGGMALIILLNFSLAFMNLLPLPVLDGGHIAQSLIETIIRRRLPFKFVSALNTVFSILLIALMVYMAFVDVMRIWNRHKLEHPNDPPSLPPAEVMVTE